MDVYAVLAYRGGLRYDFGYLVGVFDTKEAALAADEDTYSERGAKYDCEVLSLPMNRVSYGFDEQVVLPLDELRPVHREPDPLRDAALPIVEWVNPALPVSGLPSDAVEWVPWQVMTPLLDGVDVVGKRVIEVRVITHVPNPPTARVALIFSDGTTSAYLKEFPTADAADQFAAGMREALSWQDALRA